MRSKSAELKRNIYDYVNEWKRENGRSPSLSIIAGHFGVSRSTIHRYLIEMSSENRGLVYDGKTIETRELNAENMSMSPAVIIGSIPCADNREEESRLEGFVNLPISLFGRGEFFVYSASGDSVADAGINDGDIVIVLRQSSAEAGDIVAVPDEDSGVVLRRFGGCDNTAVPEQTNEAACPGSDILGVVKHIIRSLRPQKD